MKITKTQLKQIIKEELSKVLSERVLDFEELISTVSAQLKNDTVTKDVVPQLINALRQSQDPEQIKTLKILKNEVHHATGQMPRGAAYGEKSEYTKAEKEMMQKWEAEYGSELPPGFPARKVSDWYADYIRTGNLK